MTERTGRIDAHLHLWDLTVSEYSWLSPAFGPLYASWSVEQAEPELRAAGFDGAILVQAEDSRDDTRFMLDIADRTPWVLGVVGWVQLDDPAAAAHDLDGLISHPAFCGVRHLLNDDPRADLIEQPAVRASLAELAARGLPFEVHDAWPRHLGQTADLADALPELTLVVDHVGKPPRGRSDVDAWREGLARVAARPNTVAKLSGLRVPDAPFTVDALREVRDIALELFGASRLMYGGDWPMSVPFGGYQPTWAVMSELIGELSASEQDAILGGTAAQVYGVRRPDVARRSPAVPDRSGSPEPSAVRELQHPPRFDVG